MKRLLLTVTMFLLLASSSLLLAGEAQAQELSINCGAICASWTYWNGTVYGAYTVITGGVSNPPLQTNGAMWDRFISVNNGCLVCGSMIIGIEKRGTMGNSSYCIGKGAGLYFFIAAYDRYGGNIEGLCDPVPTNDINAWMALQISPYVSNGGGIQTQISIGGGDYYSHWIPYSWGIPSSFSQIVMREQIVDTVNGHEVWGVAWDRNSWLNANGVWSYQGRFGDDYKDARPPAFYWQTYPNHSKSGGTLYSCIYDNTYDLCYLGRNLKRPSR